MRRLLRIILPAALAAVSLVALALPATAGSNGQHIRAQNGHTQNLLCISGYNQNDYWQSGICTWLNNVQGGQQNDLLPSSWWWVGDCGNPDCEPVWLDSYTGYPANTTWIGWLPCAVASSYAQDWWLCNAY